MANDWLINQRLPKRPESRRGGMPMYAGMQEPDELQPSEKERGWLEKILRVALPLLAGGGMGAMMGAEARGVQAPHGGTVGSKPLMAQGLRTLAKSIEDRQKAEQELRQADEERRAKSEQEQWDRMFKEYKESEITRRKKMGILSAEKIAGMRAEPEVPTELDIKEQQTQIKKLEAQIKATNALTYKRYMDAKDPRASAYEGFDKLLKETSGNKTQAGTMLYGNALAAWAEFERTKNIQPLLMIQSLTQSAMLDTYEETTAPTYTTKEGKKIKMQETIRAKPAPDRGNLDRLMNDLLRRANIVLSKEGAGVTETTEEGVAETVDLRTQVQTAFEGGDSGALDSLAKKHGEAVINGILEELYGGQ